MARMREAVLEVFAIQKERFLENWYRYSRNRLSVLGLAVLLIIVMIAVLAPYIAPYPAHAGAFVEFREASLAPSTAHLFGTDTVGRDIFSRVIFGFRFSLMISAVVISLGVAPGVLLGLIAGYYHGTWLDTVIMRITDIFLAVPPLVLALAITAMLSPTLFHQMIAIVLVFWPWYSRLVYAVTISIRNEAFVEEAQLTGASTVHILMREILPNCFAPILTKVTLDMGIVILVAASLSFVGLGVQPPKPGLGTMVARGMALLPGEWWGTVFPALAIVAVVLAFNLVGDGLRDMFASEEM